MRPASEAELAGLIAGAREPLQVRGGQTRPLGRPPAGAPLDLSALSGVTFHEPEALAVGVRAGTPLSELVAHLDAAGQMLPFEPGDWGGLFGTAGVATVGGAVAANVSGPRRVQAGGCRDSLIGVRFVDGSGTVVRNGGRVMKNVTGYDLVKLLAGSYGTLGVLTEVIFKVLPRPATAETLFLDGVTPATAVRLMCAALGSPAAPSGAAWVSDGTGGTGCLGLRVEGLAVSVATRTLALRGSVAGLAGARSGELAEAAAFWRAVADVAPFAAVAGDVWRLALRPTDAPALLDRAGAGPAILDQGGATLWLLRPEGQDLRARLGAFAGHATLVRATPETRAAIRPFPPQPPAVEALARGLRARFDPRAILNPGLMD